MRATAKNIDPEDVDRGAGFLTKTEREFLLGQWDPNNDGPGQYKDIQASYKRSDIKKRTRHALADIALLEQQSSKEFIRSVIERNEEVTVFEERTLEHVGSGLTRFMFDITGIPREEREELLSYLRDPQTETDLKDLISRGLIESDRFEAQDKKDLGDIHPHDLAHISLYLAQQAGVSRQELLRAIRWYGVPSKQLETRLNP